MTLHAVSKHIQVLERAGLIRRRRRGREHVLSISPSSLDGAATWIAQQQQLWMQRLDTLEQLLRMDDEKSAARPKSRAGR